jgi:hypothetical protein
MKTLRDTEDPRALSDDPIFEHPPFTDPFVRASKATAKPNGGKGGNGGKK